MLTAISDGLVALLKEFYGRGPTRAKSYYEDDLVVCVLRGGFSRVEQTLLEGGRGSAVIQQRMEFQDLMRERFETVIENATGRRVIGFMSGNQQAPGHHVRGVHPRPDGPAGRARARAAGAAAFLTAEKGGFGRPARLHFSQEGFITRSARRQRVR